MHVIVLIEENKDVVPPEKPEGSQYNLDEEAERYINDLEQELQFTRENLQATIEELETSNEELQATNEELLASNEELQSTNEELQSTNEELHTVNIEYQNKIMELTESNNDIENLLTSSHVGKLLLDENCEVRRFSSYVQKVIKILDSDIGRPLTHLTHELLDIDLVKYVQQVMEKKVLIEKEVVSRAGAWYLMRIHPYEISPEMYSGTVLTFIDITEQKNNMAVIEKKVRQLEDAQQLSGIGVWELDINEKKLSWSENVYNIFEVERGSLDLTYDAFINLVHPDDREEVNQLYMDSVAKKKPYTVTHRLQLEDGRIKYVNEFCRTEYNENGEPLVSVGIVQDITEHKVMVQQLTESEQRYRSLFDTISSGVAVYKAIEDGEDFEIVDFNNYAQQIEKVTKEEVVGKRVTEVFPGIKQYGLLDVFKRVWSTGDSETLPASTYEDEKIQSMRENRVYKLPTGDIVALYNIVPDI